MSSVLASPEPFDAHKYAYIANVCVSKFARRQGIALNMLSLANDVASSAGIMFQLLRVVIYEYIYVLPSYFNLLCWYYSDSPFSLFIGLLVGMKQLFVHVNADNKPAQELYKRTGFKVGHPNL